MTARSTRRAAYDRAYGRSASTPRTCRWRDPPRRVASSWGRSCAGTRSRAMSRARSICGWMISLLADRYARCSRSLRGIRGCFFIGDCTVPSSFPNDERRPGAGRGRLRKRERVAFRIVYEYPSTGLSRRLLGVLAVLLGALLVLAGLAASIAPVL